MFSKTIFLLYSVTIVKSQHSLSCKAIKDVYLHSECCGASQDAPSVCRIESEPPTLSNAWVTPDEELAVYSTEDRMRVIISKAKTLTFRLGRPLTNVDADSVVQDIFDKNGQLPVGQAAWDLASDAAKQLKKIANRIDISSVTDSDLLVEYYSGIHAIDTAETWARAHGEIGMGYGQAGFVGGSVYRPETEFQWSGREVLSLPLQTEREVRIATNAIKNYVQWLELYLSSAQTAFANGAYPHIANWDPTKYMASVGETSPVYATTAPPTGTYSKWEPFTGIVEPYANFEKGYTVPITAFAYEFGTVAYTPVPPMGEVSNEVQQMYSSARSSVMASLSAWKDFFLSETYQSKMVYSNKPGISDVLGQGISTEISDAVYELGLMQQSTYGPSDAVWSMKRTTGAVAQADVLKVVDNYDFYQDTDTLNPDNTPRTFVHKLHDAGLAVVEYYREMMSVLLDSVQSEQPNHPIFGTASTSTFEEKLAEAARLNGDVKSEIDIYGPEGYMSPQFFADGGILLEYNKSDFDNYLRTEEFVLRKVNALSDLKDQTLFTYYPEYNRALPFQYVKADHYGSDGSGLITESPDAVDATLSHMDLIADEYPLSVYGMQRPSRTSYKANPDVNTGFAGTDREYHICCGNYYYRLSHIDNVMKYKKYVFDRIFTQVFTPEQMDFFNKAVYLPVTGRFGAYGVATLGTSKEGKNVIRDVIDTSNPKDHAVGGSLVSIGVMHEWLGGHAMVIPLQSFLLKDLLAKGKISKLRGVQAFGAHAEGFTNSLEISALDWGVYNKIVGVETDGHSVKLSETEVASLTFLQVVISAARLGPRCSASIQLAHSAYNATWGDAQNTWLLRGSLGTSMQSRALAQWTAQNCNYMPAAVFVIGAEKKLRGDLKQCFDFKGFFQAAVINAIQPATINALSAKIASWKKQVLQSCTPE